MNDVLHILLGAALVAIGVIATGVADRIRGLRIQRPQLQQPRTARAEEPSTSPTRDQSVVVAQRDDVKTDRVRGTRPPSAPPAPPRERGDVIAALIGSGYRKQDAIAAADACVAAERATLESWTRSALRHARGGAS